MTVVNNKNKNPNKLHDFLIDNNCTTDIKSLLDKPTASAVFCFNQST